MIKYIHGSKDSLDLDVVYVFDKMPNFQECQSFCSDKIENRNIVVVKDGFVAECFKGTPDELNNGLLNTYHLHEQSHPMIITDKLQRDILLKSIRVLRCLLSHCSRTQYRNEVKSALKSSSWKIKINTLKNIDFSSITDYGKSSREDVLKIFAFQLGQSVGLFEGKELFTKASIADRYQELTKYLYREKGSSTEDLITFLNKFIKIIENINYEEKDNLVYFKNFNKTINLVKEEYIGE